MLQQLGHSFDIDQAETFVAAITGSKDSTVVIQFADDRPTKRKELTRVHVGTVRQLADVIQKLNSVGAAVWVQINAGRRGIRNVTGLRACFIDDDGKSELPPLLQLAPSLSVVSSSGARKQHHYWLLVEGASLERWPTVQRQLANHYQTDKSIVNLDRVMRLPGTWNWKYEAPQPVRLQMVDASRRYTLDQLMSVHPVAADAENLAEVPKEKHTDAALAMVKRIGFWLATHAVAHDMVGPVTFRLAKCVFNPAHKAKLMVRVQSRGGIWAGCWHDSCGGNVNRWSEVKDRIGGWAADGAPFTRGDDVEVAQRLIADLTGAGEEALVGDQGQLWRYEPTVGLWRALDDTQLYQTIASYAGSAIGTKKTLKLGNGQIRATIEAARALAGQDHFFHEAPPGVAFTNGVLAATPAGTAHIPHESENRLTMGLPFAYSEDARCDRWHEFLATCFAGDADAAQKIDLLQEFLGACLMGLATRYQRMLVLLGEAGDNGKSVFLHVAGALFPSEVSASSAPQKWGHEYTRARLTGVRINVVAEMPEADILSGDAFKAIVVGDRVDARNPHERPYEYYPVAGHVVSANRMPGTSDHTNSFFKRILIVQFNQSFAVGHPLRDETLKEKLVATEMPGIAAWAAAGVARLLAVGRYTVPPSHEEAMTTWRVEADAVASFVNECCEPGNLNYAFTLSTELYSNFRAWQQANGHKTMTQTSFGRRLRGLGVLKTHTAEGNIYALKTIKRFDLGYLVS